MKKYLIALSLSSAVLLNALPLNQNQKINNYLKQAYITGVNDTLTVLQENINEFYKSKKEHIKGYILYVNIKNSPIVDIIKDEAFAIKMGLEPILTKDKIIFAVKTRKSDIDFIKKQFLENSSIKPLVDYIDKDVNKSNILINYFNQSLPLKAVLVYVKEKEIKEIIKQPPKENKTIIKITKPLHFINRVLMKKAFEKKCKNKECAPKLNINKVQTQKTIENVKKTIGKKHFDLENKKFYELTKIISKYGVIRPDNTLVLGDKIYKKGDILNKNYKIFYIKYKDGLVALNYTISIKAKKDKK